MYSDNAYSVGLSANMRAFLRVIRAGESNQTDDAYRMMFGGSLFESFADHPRRAFKSPWGWTSAAGAYQAMCAVPGKVKTDTWGDFIRSQGLHDFSPASQDKFAVWCIKRRGALKSVELGFFSVALSLCAKEWASLPGSPYGQPTRTYEQALAVYRKYGGKLSDEMSAINLHAKADNRPVNDTEVPAVADTEIVPPIVPPGGYMPAGEFIPETPMPFHSLLPIALDAIGAAVPSLVRSFGSGSVMAERNAKAAEMVVDVAKRAANAVNEQDLIEKMSEPEPREAVRQAVHASMGDFLALMVRAGEADEKSRASAVDRALALGKATGGKWLWLLGGAAATIIGFALMATWQVLFGEKPFSEGVKMLLLGQVVLAGFATVLAFLFGTNLQNRVSQRDQQQRNE